MKKWQQTQQYKETIFSVNDVLSSKLLLFFSKSF